MSAVIFTTILWGLAGGPGPSPAPPYAPTFDGPPPHAHEHDGPDGLHAPIDPTLAGPALQTPWPCGQVEYCTQGHNGGSHTGTSSWAWDFAHQLGEEIWAASAGTVTHLRMNSNTGGCSSAYSGDANYVTVDHGDGTSIVYLHMQANSSPLSVGEQVEVGDLVARVGETGYACGAHLHMQVQETCGGYYCQSLTASFADYGDPTASNQYEGTNCPGCPIALDGGTTVIDDEDAGCLVRQTTSWWSSYQGHSDHHFYTVAIDAAGSDSSALWRFGVDVPGDYLVEVFVPDADASTTNARYQVHHAAGTDEVAIDQSTAKGWQALGVYEFVGGGGEGIELGDATGEAVGLDRRIAYDAIRLSYMPSAGDTGTGDDAGATAGDGGMGTGGGTQGGVDDSGGGGFTDGGGMGGLDEGPLDGDGTSGWDGGGTGRGLPPGFGEGDAPAGCACAAGSGSEPRGAWLWLLLFGVAATRRRSVRG